jgi:hypothetical protein
MQTGFEWGNTMERTPLEDLDVEGITLLREMFKKLDGMT